MEIRNLANKECLNCKTKTCTYGVLTDNQFNTIVNNSKLLEYKPKEYIFQENEIASDIYFLCSGLVKEVRQDGFFGDLLCRILTENSYLGLPIFFSESEKKTSYIALSHVKVCSIEKNTFKEIIFENGKFAFEILINYGRDNLNSYYKYIELNHKQIYGRVADLLIYLTDTVYKDKEFINLLSREDMASMINSTRESVTRALRSFIDDGIISSNGHKITIEKREILESISRHG
jgi:CRP-like cAMP-binding protein